MAKTEPKPVQDLAVVGTVHRGQMLLKHSQLMSEQIAEVLMGVVMIYWADHEKSIADLIVQAGVRVLECQDKVAATKTRVVQACRASPTAGGENASSRHLEVRGCLEILFEDARKSMVNDLVPSVLRGDTCLLHRFFQSYRSVGTTQQVLELLLKRCDTLMNSCRHGHILACFGRGGERQGQLRKAISTILGTWLDTYHQHFQEPPDFPCLKQLVAYVQLRFPGSHLEHRAHLLLAQLQGLVPPDDESKAPSSLPEEESAVSETLELDSASEPQAPAQPPGPSSEATANTVSRQKPCFLGPLLSW
ncbi:ral guanine nucleotide dissociation stimulator-like [Octodon degus]|uniref:Ral guanine nucleotide dissociation stimulator-like n=1 Tax=Octodon degus TaxID=10160 RepID=A0A6P6DT56_OCTDE|nr:ral guanine nucleotide dissociation stimulator-like [Octodon degus]